MIVNNFLNGKRVIITGASSGLGKACAFTFSSKGAITILVGRRSSKLDVITRNIRSKGGKAYYKQCDLTKYNEIKTLCRKLNREFGGIDVLINNAGTYMGEVGLCEMSFDDWEQILNTNLRAPFLLCRELVPGMQARSCGRVVNIISGTNLLKGIGVFRISKVGLEVFTKALAQEIKGTGVTSTAFNPGWMKTETSESGRSPRGAARALTSLIQKSPIDLNGNRFDLIWVGRKFRLLKKTLFSR